MPSHSPRLPPSAAIRRSVISGMRRAFRMAFVLSTAMRMYAAAFIPSRYANRRMLFVSMVLFLSFAGVRRFFALRRAHEALSAVTDQILASGKGERFAHEPGVFGSVYCKKARAASPFSCASVGTYTSFIVMGSMPVWYMQVLIVPGVG